MQTREEKLKAKGVAYFITKRFATLNQKGLKRCSK